MTQKQKLEDFGVKIGDRITIKGFVAYAKIDKPIEGEWLIKDNQRRQSSGRMIMNKPYRTITIENVSITEGQGTPLAKYQAQRMYNKKGKITINFESKSKFPPKYAHIQDGKSVEIPDPQKNPEIGQEVYLIIKAFGSNDIIMGSSFDSIIFGEGPIRYYENSRSLIGFGQALNTEILPKAQSMQDFLFSEEPIASSFAATMQIQADADLKDQDESVSDKKEKSDSNRKQPTITTSIQQVGFNVSQDIKENQIAGVGFNRFLVNQPADAIEEDNNFDIQKDSSLYG